MEREEAEQLVAFMQAAPGWGPQINDDQAQFYANALMTIDATIASKAILDGISEWRFAPSLAQIYERVKEEKISAQYRDAVDHTINLPDREPVPQWGQEWMCARLLYAKFGREKDDRAFQEQLPHYTTEEIMPPGEWSKEAGSVNPETFSRLWGHVLNNPGILDQDTPLADLLGPT